MTEAKSVAKDNASSHMLETGPFGESCVRVQDIVKRCDGRCEQKWYLLFVSLKFLKNVNAKGALVVRSEIWQILQDEGILHSWRGVQYLIVCIQLFIVRWMKIDLFPFELCLSYVSTPWCFCIEYWWCFCQKRGQFGPNIVCKMCKWQYKNIICISIFVCSRGVALLHLIDQKSSCLQALCELASGLHHYLCCGDYL